MLDTNSIVTGTLITELVMLFILKYIYSFSTQLHVWYAKFGIMAILADVLVIVIVFILAKYIYTRFYGDELVIWKFALILLGLQIVHDILFYFLLIKPTTRNTNDMIDLFKDYADELSYNIIWGDSLLVLFSLLFAVLLQTYLPNVTNEIAIIVVYIIIYVVYKRA